MSRPVGPDPRTVPIGMLRAAWDWLSEFDPEFSRPPFLECNGWTLISNLDATLPGGWQAFDAAWREVHGYSPKPDLRHIDSLNDAVSAALGGAAPFECLVALADNVKAMEQAAYRAADEAMSDHRLRQEAREADADGHRAEGNILCKVLGDQSSLGMSLRFLGLPVEHL